MPSLFSRLVAATLVAWLAAPTAYAGQQRGRIALFAVDRVSGREIAPVPVRLGREVRSALAPSGRELLALRPAQVAAGGRVFVFGPVPGDSGMEEFAAEALVWVGDRWSRRSLVGKEVGRLGFVSATVLVPEAETQSVATAVFRRAGVRPDPITITSPPVSVPRRALLRFSYGLDEWDLTDVSPVTVVVVAVMDDEFGGAREIELFRAPIMPIAAAEGVSGWIDKEVDLSRLGGAVARFEFRALVREAAGKLRPHVAWGPATIVGGDPGARRPSVVLVTLDGVRARSLGSYGAERATSPFLDELFGEQGIVFDSAVTQSVESVPANMTLFTGLYPSVHGVQSAARGLASGVETLATRLSSSGYAAAGFSDGTLLAAEAGFGRGFQVWAELGDVDPWRVDPLTSEATQRALDFVGRHDGEPVFVFLHLTRALPPYVPPPGYLDYFKDSRLEGDSDLDEGALVRYEREIRHLDDAMRDFVARLDKLSSSDATLLVVTSTHGQEFLEHGAREAGTQLFDESIRVPLMMRGAGLRKGKRYGEHIGLIDVMPTLLDLAGAALPAGIQGKSVAKAARSGLPFSLPPRFVEARGAERRVFKGKSSTWKAPAYAIVDGGHKLILPASAGQEAKLKAYDLVSDRAEATNLLAGDAQAPPWVAELRDELLNYETACRRVAREPERDPPVPVRTRLTLAAERAR